MPRKLLFSVTAADCEWDYYKGSGAGGQKRNKTSNAVRCRHRASGAMGQSEDSRSQYDNKRSAFKRMVKTDKFQNWLKIEKSRRLGIEAEIEREVNKMMKLDKLRFEVRDEEGRWTEIDPKEIKDEDSECIARRDRD